MTTISIRGRLRRRLAFALALAVSGCAQTVSLVAADSFAAVFVTQNKTAASSRDRSSQDNRRSEANSTKNSRGAEPALESVHHASPDGPMIRIALMTDVTSVTLSCASGLSVNRPSAGFAEAKRISSGTLRVELSALTDAVTLVDSSLTYGVIVRYVNESRVARNLSEELKKLFFEPVKVTYDRNQNEYAVMIGDYETRSEATRLAERLRKAGYEGLRIVNHPMNGETAAPESATVAKLQRPKDNTQPGRGARQPLQLVALAGDRMALSSRDELIVTPAQNTSTANLIKTKSVSPGSDVSRSGNADQRELTHLGITAHPPAVRLGSRDYRGEMHLVLNARGLINVVNVLPLEEYVRGVVLMEMPLGSPREIDALKAQAIAARSYAVYHIGRHQDRGYDLVDDARAQVYGGLTAEHEFANRATEQTSGVVGVYKNEAGNLVPIEALFTANCGGRTENNEEVFGGNARGYLRSVACVPDRQPLTGRDIVTNRTIEPLTGSTGHLIAREVAMLSVLGFPFPRRVTNNYLQGTLDRDEMRIWTEHAARLARRDESRLVRGDVTRVAEFARFIADSVYGEGRARSLMEPADVDYLLTGIPIEQLPREARADVAILLRDGIFQLHSAALDGKATITRGQAIETLARAVLFKSTSDLRSPDSKTRSQLANLKMEISAPAESGRLILAGATDASSLGQTPRFTSVNITGRTSIERVAQDETRDDRSSGTGKELGLSKAKEQTQRKLKSDGIEIAEDAWLFRKIGGESYAVNRLTLIGGERVTYHKNSGGEVDFLEASVSAQSAAIGGSIVGSWQERLTVEALKQRLARSRVNVGQPTNVEAIALSTSNRVSELEVTGDRGRSRLRGRQITSALGLKETLFVVNAEQDARGQVIAFVFTGRGWGHGVGMCQHGAYELAREGYSYTAILQRYYTGIKLKKIY